MSSAVRSSQDKRLHSLVREMEKVYGSGEKQSGSNGDELLFNCPLCTEEGKGEGHRKHLRITTSIESDREFPYVGCRIHGDSWNDIRKALIKSGIPTSLLSPAEGKTVVQSKAPRNSGPGLGEEEPIEPAIVDQACRILLGNPKAEKYRKYLLGRGLTLETIKRFRLGVSAKVYQKPRITIPIPNSNGDYVNVRCYLPFSHSDKDVKILPWPHPKKKQDNGKRETYGRPARIFGVEDIVKDEPIVFCAGEFDRMILMQNGINSATGTSAEGTVPRREDCDVLVQASDIFIVYDCDKAGRSGAKKLAGSLMKIGAEKIKLVDLDVSRDDGYDVSDFFRDGNGPEEFWKIVEETSYVEPPEKLPELSDRRMAELVAEEFSQRIRYLIDGEAWLGWREGRWQTGNRKDVTIASNAVVEMARIIRDERTEDRKGLEAKYFEGILRTGLVKNVITQISWLPDMQIKTAQLDAATHLLNVRNGTIDLETGKVREPRPDDMLSRSANGAYTPGLKNQLWTDFLARFVPDEEMQRYLQKLMGYCIEDGNPHRLFIIFKGGTSTGKSAFSEVVMRSLGDYAGSFNLSLFRDKQDESPRADIVQMLTQRIGFASETSSEWHLHADSIKRITGSDTIKARLLYSNAYFERIPAFTPIIRTNSAPTIKAADMALFRRLRVIPFNHQISEEDVDPNFVGRMMKESIDAILSWVIDGYLDYKANGFDRIPQECLEAEMEFRDEVSVLSQFIKDHCVTEYGGRTPANDLYQAYQVWAMEGGFSQREVLNKIDFGRKLTGLGYKTSISNGIRYRTGLKLVGAERVT